MTKIVLRLRGYGQCGNKVEAVNAVIYICICGGLEIFPSVKKCFYPGCVADDAHPGFFCTKF